MTLTDRPVSATHPERQSAAAPRESLVSRLLNCVIPGRRAAIRRHEQLIEMAKQNPPPQRWHDEDFSALRKPRS